MMSKSLFTLAIVVAGFLIPSDAYSWSSTCVTRNGKQDCTSQNDPNGNMAAGGAVIRGDQGEIAAGAGTPDNFNTNRQQINYGNGAPFDEPGYGGIPPNFGGGMQPNFGGGMQPNFGGGMQPNFGGGMQPNFGGGIQPSNDGGMAPNFGYGPNGVSAGSSSGFPQNFGPFFPQWNGNPFAFAQGFMRNRRRR